MRPGNESVLDAPSSTATASHGGMGPAAPAATRAENAAPLVLDRASCPAPDNYWQCWKRSIYARSPLLRSSPFRIGISFWLLFSLIVGIAGYGFYATLKQRTVDQLDDSLSARHSLMQALYDANGIQGIVEYTEAREEVPMRTPMGIHLESADGQAILSNVDLSDPRFGLKIMHSSELGLEGDSDYRILSAPLGDYKLSIGRSLAPVEDLREVAIYCLIWAFAASMILSLLAAIWVGRRSTCRMSGFSKALSMVAAGNMTERVPVSSDMDDVDEMALHVNAALDRLQDNVDSIRQVSTDIAHDLKTPLNRLNIHLNEACDVVENLQGEKVANARDSLESAVKEADHINSTFEALLRVAQVESGSRRANFKNFDMRGVLETAAEIYEVVAEESGQSLTSKLDGSVELPVVGDKQLIMQLAVNLLENASHHSPEGTSIEIDAGVDDEAVWFSVSDTGPGIPESERENVFRRLYRLERSRTTPGSGLGLNMVKAITELHGGLIKLEDNGPGLKVTVRFCPEGGTAKPF